MPYQLLFELNPFLLSLIFFVLIYFRRCRENRFIRVVVVVNFFLFLSFELYFHSFECRVSRRYYRDNSRLLRRVIDLFEQKQLVYWLDFGTLLNQLRHEPINKWDQDSDISILDPDYSLNDTSTSMINEGTVTKNIQALIDLFEEQGLMVTYDPRRHYLQVWADTISANREDGPHLDLWLWIPQLHSNGKEHLLRSLDRKIHFNPRPEEQIFPLQRVQWLNQSTWIPRHAHQISQREFEIYSGSYLQAKTFRTDCFHNLFNRRFNF